LEHIGVVGLAAAVDQLFDVYAIVDRRRPPEPPG
jgi:hypothetical protein